MAKSKTFRIGRVSVYLRGRVWYLRYHENGRRHQVRGGDDEDAVRRLAAQVNAQLETGAPVMTSIESVTIADLRRRWLDHHEHVLRSSVATINRYRTATDHLLRFVDGEGQRAQKVANFRPSHAEQFVRHLRELRVAPNGHAKARKRALSGKGIKFILQACRTLFNFALKRRYLSPYMDNPFSVIEIDRMPISDGRRHRGLTLEQEQQLLEACDAGRTNGAPNSTEDTRRPPATLPAAGATGLSFARRAFSRCKHRRSTHFRNAWPRNLWTLDTLALLLAAMWIATDPAPLHGQADDDEWRVNPRWERRENPEPLDAPTVRAGGRSGPASAPRATATRATATGHASATSATSRPT